MAIQKVTSSLIADNAVGLDQLNLSDGTDGQFLKTNGSGTLSFADAAGGGGGAWNVISHTSVSSAVASIEFTLSGYLDYMLVFRNPIPAQWNWNHNRFFFSTNNGSSYSSNITQVEERNMAWAGSSNSGATSQGYVEIGEGANASFITQQQIGSGTINLWNNVSGVAKTGTYMRMDYDGRYGVMHETGAFSVDETAVINKIKYMFDGNGTTNITSGSFTLYGLATS